MFYSIFFFWKLFCSINQILNLTELTLIIFGNLFLKDKYFVEFFSGTELIDKVISICEICQKYGGNRLNKIKHELLFNLTCLSLNAHFLNYEKRLKVCECICLHSLHEFKNKLLMINALERISYENDESILNHIYCSSIIEDLVAEVHNNNYDYNEKIFRPLTFLICQLSQLDDLCLEKIFKHRYIDLLMICIKNKKLKRILCKNDYDKVLCQCFLGIYNISLKYKKIVNLLMDLNILTTFVDEFLSNENDFVRENVCFLIYSCIVHINDIEYEYLYYNEFFSKICDYLYKDKRDTNKNYMILIKICMNFIDKGIKIFDNEIKGLFLEEIFNFGIEKAFYKVYSGLNRKYDYEYMWEFHCFECQLREWKCIKMSNNIIFDCNS